ncbi:choline kinase [Malassezia psittaci]|uniref:Choline kinase n=1 Tax=Malassezia psittaci TaxID=1821823 RepID=A0AAF0JFF3_9BASI|nr:choline kinase [Malassezia psittaci]
MSAWYRPPSPDFFESVDEDLDSLALDDLDENAPTPVPAAWSPGTSGYDDGFESEEMEQLDDDEEDMHASGIPAARGWILDAREAKTDAFREKVLRMFRDVLTLPGWTDDQVNPAISPLQPEFVKLKRISGALTNAVFFVSYEPAGGPVTPAPPTLLLRVYGPGSESLLSRRTELLILHTLSSLYEIGPHIMGTFANGRVEEFYECDAIGLDGMRDLGSDGKEGVAQWVARRMRELHEVPLDVMRTVLEQGDLKVPTAKGFGRGIENHILAASHSPRRRQRTSTTDYAMSPGPDMQTYSYFAHPSPNMFTKHDNTSNMSFDSLATTYDSPASFAARSPSSGRVFGRQSEQVMSPLSLGPSVSVSTNIRAPYPGVWRRLKRWTRESCKVIEMVNQSLATPEGQAVTKALNLPGLLPVTAEGHPHVIRTLSKNLRSTSEHFADMIKCLVAMDIPQFCLEVIEYKKWVRAWEAEHGKSRRVFCHNDSQPGNLLILRLGEDGELPLMGLGMRRDAPAPNSPEVLARSPRRRPRSRSRSAQPHQRLAVIDFEYAGPNPRAFDIANHFNEWRADYNAPVDSWSHYAHGAYPTESERRRWLRAYVEHGLALTSRSSIEKLASPETTGISEISLPPAITTPTSTNAPNSPTPQEKQQLLIEKEIDRLEQEITVWTPATNAVWGLWGIVIARDDILALIEREKAFVHRMPDGSYEYQPDIPVQHTLPQPSAENFDNLRFSLGRMEIFRKELQALVHPTETS